MRRIALINQKGGVGKTTTACNLGAALARAGQRVLLIDLDPQANLTLHLGVELAAGERSVYDVLIGETEIADVVRATATPNLSLLPSHLDLSGAELELAARMGRESLLAGALERWVLAAGEEPVDYLLLDCPPSLGLLSINALVSAREVFLAVQTEFFALQGVAKLVDVIELVRRNLRSEIELTGIVPCMYDNRRRLAREVLGELRKHFGERVFTTTVASNVKLAEAPGFGQTIFEYAPGSVGARAYAELAAEVIAQVADDAQTEELRDVELTPPADVAARETA